MKVRGSPVFVLFMVVVLMAAAMIATGSAMAGQTNLNFAVVQTGTLTAEISGGGNTDVISFMVSMNTLEANPTVDPIRNFTDGCAIKKFPTPAAFSPNEEAGSQNLQAVATVSQSDVEFKNTDAQQYAANEATTFECLIADANMNAISKHNFSGMNQQACAGCHAQMRTQAPNNHGFPSRTVHRLLWYTSGSGCNNVSCLAPGTV